LLAFCTDGVNTFPNGKINWTSMQTPQQLGNQLRLARKQLQLTQSQLALVAGVGVRFVVDLEAGKPTVRLEQVLRVIDALGGELILTGLNTGETMTTLDTGAGHGT
jgi:y4mF family transcriptional regulator